MGGDIWAESEGSGKGTTFHFVLPFRVAEQIHKTSQHAPHIVLRDKSLLVVDDNATNRLIVKRMARSWGMSTVDCGSGYEALEKIDAGLKVDAAVLDVQMPDMDGISLSGELRQRLSERELPLIIISSLGQKLPLPAGVNASAYLHKPVKPSQLYDALISAFDAQIEKRAVLSPLETGFDAQMGDRHPLRILLAEDHVVNQKVMKLMLERLGYRADIVANGLEALQSFKRRDYDVVLMDIQMPEMNGIEATQSLRTELPPERQPRIIALTANALGGEREEYISAGMDDYLSKPVNVVSMRAALEKCMPLEINQKMMESDPMPESFTSSAPSAPVPASGSIDIPTLKEYFPYEGEDLRMVIDLSEEFLADAEGRLRQLKTSFEQGDAGAVGKTAHALKGASLTFGAKAFSALCQDLEQMGKSGELSGVAEKLAEAQAEYARVQIELPAILKGMLP
jgi:CheY-like chemotaxis protein/HPt (histidine-containing phosphotransfer) domain-containing protein